MINWCDNILKIEGSDEILNIFMGHCKTEGKKKDQIVYKIEFETFAPLPLGQEDNWYEWYENNWGTNMKASEAQFVQKEDTIAIFEFSTSEKPPIPFIRRLSKQFPELNFDLYFFEIESRLAGEVQYHGGKKKFEFVQPKDEQQINEFVTEVFDYVPYELKEE